VKLLFVEDDSDTIGAFQTALDDWNEDHGNGSEIQSECKKSCGEAVAYIEGLDSVGLTGMIVDLTLEDGEGVGNVLLQKLDDMHRRIPVVVFTATPAALQFPYLLATYKKGEKRYEDIFKLFTAAEQIGLTKILGGDGSIEKMLQHVFNVAILPRVNSWIAYANSNGLDKAEKALSRSVVEHLHIAMDNDESFAPDEFYISNLGNSDYVKAGEVLRTVNGASSSLYVVMSPACDLALHGMPGKPKSEVVLLARLVTFSSLYGKVCADTVKAEAKRKVMNKFVSNTYSGNLHYFPAAVGLEQMLLDFRFLETVKHDLVKERFISTGYCVSPCFFRDIQCRFSAYYGRQGQPELCV